MEQKIRTPGATPDEKIVHAAIEWRRCDKERIARKDLGSKSAEWRARQHLAKTVDEAGGAK